MHHHHPHRLRPVGTALSPNGLGMSEEAMVSVAHLDKVLNIDTANLLVTVEAGARVSQVRGGACCDVCSPGLLSAMLVAAPSMVSLGCMLNVSLLMYGRCWRRCRSTG
jgi:hypothetical protein